jgi:hypothetical protein
VNDLPILKLCSTQLVKLVAKSSSLLKENCILLQCHLISQVKEILYSQVTLFSTASFSEKIGSSIFVSRISKLTWLL